MRILITNDDGIEGEGLHVLVDALKDEHEVWVITPDINRSAVSNGISMFKNLELKKISDRVYTSSGLPADCVLTAVCGDLLSQKFDVVLSGINKGPNMGTDLIYSGTVAAARQASVLGIAGIALSIESKDDIYRYNALASFVSKNLEKLVGLYKDGYFLNINALSLDSYKGVRFTNLCKKRYKDTISIKKADAEDNFVCLFCGGGVVTTGDNNCDDSVINSEMISVSRVRTEPVADDIDEEVPFVL